MGVSELTAVSSTTAHKELDYKNRRAGTKSGLFSALHPDPSKTQVTWEVLMKYLLNLDHK